MKKWMVTAAVGAGAAGAIAMVARRCSPSADGPTMWDKMREHMEQMPDDFPPRILFDNAKAAKENTDRILELLQRDNEPPLTAETVEQRAEVEV